MIHETGRLMTALYCQRQRNVNDRTRAWNLSRGGSVFNATDAPSGGKERESDTPPLHILRGPGALIHAVRLRRDAPASAGESPRELALLLVTRSGNPPDHLFPLFGGSTDATAVRRLYHAIYALPRMPPGAVTSCPADDGVEYALTFMDSRGALILRVSLDASGCQLLRLSDGDTCMTDDAFWALLARGTGIPATAMH